MNVGPTPSSSAPAVTAPDGVLVARIRGGDHGALEPLFARHQDAVTGVCRRRLTDAADVSDAVQETFLRALDRIDDLREPDAFGGWVRAIAARAAVDQLRSRARSWSLDRVHDVADDAAAPDELVELSEDRTRLRTALEGLGERDRAALWLRHGTEAPIAEVAQALGLTEGSARVILTRARQRLRTAVSHLAGLVPVPMFLRRPRGSLASRFAWLDPSSVLIPLATAAAVAIAPSTGPADASTSPATDDAPATVVAPSAPPASHGADPTSAIARIGPPSATPAGTRSGATADQPEERGGTVAGLSDDVRVQEGYPEEEPYAVEVRVIGSDDDTATWRLYAPTDVLPGPIVGVAAVSDTVGDLDDR